MSVWECRQRALYNDELADATYKVHVGHNCLRSGGIEVAGFLPGKHGHGSRQRPRGQSSVLANCILFGAKANLEARVSVVPDLPTTC